MPYHLESLYAYLLAVPLLLLLQQPYLSGAGRDGVE